MKHQETGAAAEPPQDQPPPYEAVPPDLEGIRVNNDGRISIDASSRLCRTLSRLIPTSPIQSTPPSGPPPSYEDLVVTPPRFNLNIVIQIVGSRGDVQPFLALGTELQRTGHRVRIATHNVFEKFVGEAGLEFYPIGGDPADLMAYMVKNPGLIPGMKSLRKGDIQKDLLMMAEILHGCWHSCLMPDPVTNTPLVANAIIANPPSFAHVHCAQALGIPIHLIFTMPWTATRAFPHPLANLYNIHPDQDWINRVSYSVVDWLSWQGLGGVINDWRKHELGLEPISLSDGPFLLKTLQIPYTYCWSPGLVPKPHDWPANADYQPNCEVVAFLNSGPPPIYIGFGSIVIENPGRMAEILLQATQETGVRAIISRGWSNLNGPDLPHILYLDDCPHEWLFQHVCAVVHHGGAGTTACVLRNGKPTIIVPFFGDQPFWGDMTSAAHAGPDPIPHKQLNIPNLVHAIRYCLTPEATRAAQDVANKMQQDQGVKAAVASFHRHLPHVTECVSSAGLGMAFEMLKAGGNIIYKPYEVYKGGSRDSLSSIHSPKNSPQLLSPVSSNAGESSSSLRKARSMNYLTEANKLEPKEKGKARAMASALTQASGKFLGKFVSGTMVDVPLAAAEGFRVLPGLYGGNIHNSDRVTDWKSGMLAGPRTFAVGMAESCVDPFYQPYKGARDAGALGFASGLFKGTFGVIAKMGHGSVVADALYSAASIGLVAYPGQGIKRSVKAAFFESTQRGIATSLREDGQDMARQWRVRGSQDGVVV
ncbi:uncharacterized protein N7446_004791 [Penicillium canescens]|uniref:Glycosyltransferase family 28 N-terminal domain-containing protein n=1 Tax=Penicillium canescens TaxID=5083 RepID=A0AAD6N2T6_PENCN|nr:uncharacterized protein N7446_004791 [Penicillium canescens]KAJ6026609.1 hypothetical protein N7460_011426 [Penicillium canescens]KAJ6067754.1 hypothetical protein N7446_004791 [Penicillium canescens]